MDRDTVIALAREAGAVFPADGSWHKFEVEGSLERFAALVAAEKDKEIKMLAKALKREQKKNEELISSMETAVRLALKAEREACAEPEQKPVAWMYREPGNPFLRVHVDEFDYEQIPEDDEWFPVYRQAKRSTHDQNDHS